jgi:CheY-like chemotaxis protein
MSFKKILVMDEEYWSIEPAIDRIESLFGKEILEYSSNGVEGLRQLKDHNFKCIILDIMFPMGDDMDILEEEEGLKSISGGISVLHEIRNTLKMKTPVICFTIRDDDEVKASIKKYANTIHISKLNMNGLELLINQIKRYID